MVRGQQKEVLTPGQNVKWYLAGALDAETGELIWVESEKKNSLLFIQLLWRLTQHYPDAKRPILQEKKKSPDKTRTPDRCLRTPRTIIVNSYLEDFAILRERGISHPDMA